MKRWIIPALVATVAALALLASRGLAYVEAPMSLGAVVAQSTNIMLIRVDSVDKKNNTIVYRKVRDIKGKHPTDVIKHNIGRAGLRPDEWKPPIDWAEPGKLGVFFHNGGASETCIGTWWYQAYAGGEWWNHSHGEPYLLRSYCGSPEKLAAQVAQMLENREVIVTCMIDSANKEDLHQRRGKIQRLKASLKLQDYNPKRDFVGWGGEDFRRLLGMPGFTHVSPLPRTDPEAQAISIVDFDGDGKQDICLVGGGRVAVLQNGGESLNEFVLPGVAGARCAVWADYNGDGRPDLLVVTPSGPRLFTNHATGFRDDTQLLPREVLAGATAAAWIDFDGDGRPDLLVAYGYHGLRLYRNRFDPAPLVKQLDSDKVEERDRAFHMLNGLGPVVEPELRKMLTGKVSVGFRQRVEQLSQRWKGAPVNIPPPKTPVTVPTWFTDVSAKVGLGADGIGADLKSDALTVCDVNGDGIPDFLFGGMLVLGSKNERGEITFAAVKDSGIAWPAGKVNAVFGDFDDDGYLDLVLTHKGGIRLLKGDGKGRFTDVTARAGDLGKFTGWATSAAWGDIDNDGRLDLIVGCIRGPNRFFRNQGDGTFLDCTDKIGLAQKIYNSQAVAVVDLNNDGQLDMIFNNEGQDAVVLLGDRASANGKKVPLTLTLKAGDGLVGSRIEVRDKQGKLCGVRQVSGGDGRGGQQSPQMRFTLDPGTYQVQVRLSSGQLRTKEITVENDPMRAVIGEPPATAQAK
jgi:FG-GAP-like repeat